MSIRPSTRTYANLMRDVKRRFGDESGVQLEEADILQWANDGQQQIVTENKVLRSKGTHAVAIGEFEFTFPLLEIHSVTSIHYNNAPLRNLTFEDAEQTISSADPDRTQAGTPLVWYLWDDTFTVWPTPDAAGLLTVYFTRLPAPLTGDPGQVLDVSDKYYPALVNYVLQQAYEMDEDWQASQAKEAQFKTALAEQREEDFLAADNFYPIITEIPT